VSQEDRTPRGPARAYETFCFMCAALFAACCGCSGYMAAPPFSGVIKDTGRPPRIVVYGDTRRRHPMEFWLKDTTLARQSVAYRVAQIRPDVVINTGDIVDRGGSPGAWKVFDEENAWLRRMGVPYYPALGNHEYQGGSTQDALHNYFARFPYLNNKRWYKLRVGPVMFLMLDSNFDEMTDEEVRSQLRWLQASLDDCERDTSIKMSVITTHHPPFSHSHNEYPSAKVTHLILPLTGGYSKLKLFYSGHSHTYERFRVGGLHYIVTGGGGAPLDSTEEAVFPEDLYEGGLIRGFHYCLMTLYKKQCSIEMFELQPDGSWVVRDSVEIMY